LIAKKIIHWLGRTSYGRKAVETHADLSIFTGKPPLKILLGLILLVISYIICWPAISVLGFAALYLNESMILIIGGPVAYGLSWLVWTLSMIMLGKENYKYINALSQWVVRRLIEKYSDDNQGSNSESEDCINSASTSSKRNE
jgi:hypothetical protein